jgi:basic membrane protein A and related proteins
MRLKSAIVAGALLAMAGTAYTAYAADGFSLKEPAKVAFLYFKAKNDGGWTQAFEEARPKMEKALHLKIPYVENIAEDAAQITPPAEKFIQRGYNIIIGTAFGYSDTFKELAQKHPTVAFLNAAGTTNGANLQSFYGRTYESQYLCGMVAGAMSKTGKLGFVGANPFGIVNWTINAYEMGAKKMNPKATVTAVFTGAWNDPVKERAAAAALIDQGADVLGMHVDTPTVPIVAQERGVYATGHHRDMREFAPKSVLCSSVWVWAKYLVPEIKKIEAGNWQPNPYGDFISIKDGGTDIACCNKVVPKAVVEKVMAARQGLIDGSAPVYAGPIVDREGKERVAAGKVISDGDLWKMDWYVPGVITQK